MNVRLRSASGFCMGIVMLTSCAVGPDYVRPTVPQAQAYKELDGWRLAQPRDDTMMAPDWWEVFHDETLNGLIKQADEANQTVLQAQATLRQELALVDSARSAFYPTVTLNGSNNHSRGAAFVINGNPIEPGISTSHVVSMGAAWTPDLWGSVRRNVESSVATAESSLATLAFTRLTIDSELAIDYFQLRGLDGQKKLLEDTIVAYQRALDLTKNQFSVGVAQLSDVVQAQTQLVSTQAAAVDVGVQRAQLEHAIAMLTGKAPGEFSLPQVPLTIDYLVPPAPVGVPSKLLERRPDIAAAERKVAAANAQIGVAEAAYFPDLTLSATTGYSSLTFAKWLTAPNRFWAFGPSLVETIFDGGARSAAVDSARAVFDQNVAAYRQSVLTAFQGVEDALAGLNLLEQEDKLQLEAVRLAQKALDLEMNRYKAGTDSYANVIISQTTLLTNQRTELTLLSQRVTYSVQLIEALGGGWDASHLSEKDLDMLGRNDATATP